MFKMVIVDDEEFTRQQIREAVNWEAMDIEIIGEADNGLTAMIVIHELNPDILICDVRMPKLDGISLVNELHPLFPDMQVLFLSGYSDTEYLKNAIKLEAVDYIFKPFELSELIAAIEKAKKNSLKCRAKSSRMDMNAALELLQYDSGLMTEASIRGLPINLDTGMISLIIKLNLNDRLQTDSHSSLYDTRIAAGHYYTSFRDIAERIFHGKFVMTSIGEGYILHTNVPADYTTRLSAVSELEEFFGAIENGRSFITIGVGNPCVSIKTLRGSYSEARMAEQAAFLSGYGKVIFFGQLSREAFVPYTDLQEKLYDNILSNNFTPAISYLKNYIDYMRRCSPKDIPAIKDVLVSIAFWFHSQEKRFLPEQKGYIADLIHQTADIGGVENYILGQINKYIENIANLDNKGRVLLEAEQYIIQNYDKPLTIKEIAQQVYLTPNYLCYLYKSRTKRTLYQFILDVKMEKAKKLLCETNKPLTEVADALGYGNQNYFTKLFTKYYGISPRVYRNQHSSADLNQP